MSEEDITVACFLQLAERVEELSNTRSKLKNLQSDVQSLQDICTERENAAIENETAIQKLQQERESNLSEVRENGWNQKKSLGGW